MNSQKTQSENMNQPETTKYSKLSRSSSSSSLESRTVSVYSLLPLNYLHGSRCEPQKQTVIAPSGADLDVASVARAEDETQHAVVLVADKVVEVGDVFVAVVDVEMLAAVCVEPELEVDWPGGGGGGCGDDGCAWVQSYAKVSYRTYTIFLVQIQ